MIIACIIVTADQREGNEGKYRVGFSATPEYDPDNILISQKSATVEDIREGLKGLADGTYVVGEKGLERAQASENAPASDGGVKIEQIPPKPQTRHRGQNLRARRAFGTILSQQKTAKFLSRQAETS